MMPKDATYVPEVEVPNIRILTNPMMTLFVSDDVEELLGFKPKEFLTGKVSLRSRIHNDDQDIADNLFSTGIEQTSGTFNVRLRHANGSIRCVKGQFTKSLDATYNGVILELQLQDARKLRHVLRDQPMMDNFKSMMENTDDYIYFKDRNHVFTGASQTLVTITDPSEHWSDLIGLTDYDVFPEEYADIYYRLEKQVFAGITVAHEIQEMLDNEGNKGWVDNRKYPIRDENGKITGLFGIARDITELKLLEQNLRISATAFETQEGILVTDADRVILRVNQAFTNITGYTAEEVIGKNPNMLSSGRHDAAFYAAMWENVNNMGAWVGEVWNRRKNGEVYPEHLTITAVKDPAGTVINYVATLAEITMSKAAAEEIQRLAFYDPLTSLPNRRLLLDRLRQALTASARSGKDGALMFIDLDNYKTLNDTLGHEVGDILLQQVASRLADCVREADTVARIGGDEYVVMLEGLSEENLMAAAQAKAVGEKILTALNQPYQLATHEYQSTASIGVALFSNHDQSLENLLKHADIAMYQAKKAGRNTMRFFDPQMQDAINIRVDFERELRKALEQQQFQLHYQIQVDNLGCPLGAEALIRWLHPERGLVSPFHFIPLAEETGLILPIGQWVLDTACAQLKAWQQDELTRDLTLSINVSAKQFYQADFVAQVNAAVQHYRINPMRLKLELTESMLLDNIDSTIATMNALKELGIRFSLDDFGTGYSSLQYLKRLPLYQLKIDQSFVRDIAADSSDQAIVRTIIAMAHTLNLNVIAEGVESEEQRQLLLNAGCAHYQGYLFGKPAPIAQFEAVLEAGLISNEVVLCA